MLLLVWGNLCLAQEASLPLFVRLTSALTSYTSTTGAEFHSVVIAPYRYEGRVLMPPGTRIKGRIHATKRVGIGLIRERASIELKFDQYQTPDGRKFPFEATLTEIDNARESVTESGKIRGILAANNPQSLLHGVWHRPRLGSFPRSFIGLTGAGGKIFTSYSMGPIGAAGLFAARLAMFRLPEPEIQLLAGTEMTLAVKQLPGDAPSFPEPEPSPLAVEISQWLKDQPVDVMKPGGVEASDIINLAFLGTREELAGAFGSAGWHEADPLNARTFSRAYKSYTRQTGYPTAPVSKLLYRDAEADLIFQKSLNNLSKRHHIRLWRVDAWEGDVWLGAATHDVGIKFNRKAMTFTHKIDARIDAEREKVVNDLLYTGCLPPAAYIPRPAAIRNNEVSSDGRLAVMVLKDPCATLPEFAEPDAPAHPKSRATRIARRMMLEGRQYALRGNAYYWAYRAVTFRRAPKVESESTGE